MKRTRRPINSKRKKNTDKIASRMALELLSGIKYSSKVDLKKKIFGIHTKLTRYSKAHPDSANMQTTLCAIAVDENDNASIINIGDSRMYCYREGKIKQLSTDQSLVQLLYEQGKISQREKRTHSHKNVIFPVLGNIDQVPDPQIKAINGGIKSGDVIIICTDGVSDYVTQGQFEEALAEPMNLSKRLRKITEIAAQNGSTDNMTIIGISKKSIMTSTKPRKKVFLKRVQ